MRRRNPRLPDFKPVCELQTGDAFNPYRDFSPYTVRRELLRSTKMRPGAKVLWLVLAQQCWKYGHDWNEQSSLAEKCGLSRRQVERHLAALQKLRLIHVEPTLGRANRTWMLYHPLFAGCSPSAPVTSDVPPTTLVTDTYDTSGSHNIYSNRALNPWGTLGIYKGTSSRGAVAQKGGEKAKGNGNGKAMAAGSDNEYSVQAAPPNHVSFSGEGPNPSGTQRPPLLKANARRSWNTLEKRAQEIRYERACQLAGRIQYLRQHLNSPDAGIGRAARVQEAQASRELSEAGFYLPNN